MAIADDLMTSAKRFYALARMASNATTKLQLVCLGDDYFRQANELWHAQMISSDGENNGTAIKRLAEQGSH